MVDERFTFTNARGQAVTLTNEAPYVLQTIDGMGATSVEVQRTKAPYQDGSTLLDKVLGDRNLIISFSIFATSDQDLYAKRRLISQVFNPKLGQGRVRYIYPGGVRAVGATVEEAPTFPMRPGDYGEQYQRAVVSLVCTNPFWADDKDISHRLVAFEGLFKFPLKLPTKMGIAGSFITLNNVGDVPTPVKLTIYGPIDHPTITNETTGEYIRVNTLIQEGERVEINTAFGKKRVELIDAEGVRSNIFNKIDIDSTFWSLEVGNNKVSYTALESGSGTSIYIEHNRRYVGI